MACTQEWCLQTGWACITSAFYGQGRTESCDTGCYHCFYDYDVVLLVGDCFVEHAVRAATHAVDRKKTNIKKSYQRQTADEQVWCVREVMDEAVSQALQLHKGLRGSDQPR